MWNYIYLYMCRYRCAYIYYAHILTLYAHSFCVSKEVILSWRMSVKSEKFDVIVN